MTAEAYQEPRPSWELSTYYRWRWKWKLLSRVWLFATPWLYSPWNSPGQNSGVGNLSLLQGVFPTQGLNPGLPYCRWILYQLRYQKKLGNMKKQSTKRWYSYEYRRKSYIKNYKHLLHNQVYLHKIYELMRTYQIINSWTTKNVKHDFSMRSQYYPSRIF